MIENDNNRGESSSNEQPNGVAPAHSTSYDGKPDDLHDLFGSGPGFPDEEDPLAALRNDPNYSALIRDLEYIASQARLLFEPAESAPSDEVWNKIQSKLAEDPDDSKA